MVLKQKQMKRFKKWTSILLATFFIVLLAGVWFIKTSTYQAEVLAIESAQSAKTATTSYSYFEPATPDDQKETLIIYSGGLVEDTAYAHLAQGLAQKGYPVYLLHSPLNLPILNQGQALKVIKEQGLSSVYLIGHSLGGVVAASDAAKHSNSIDGLILLASYPASSNDLSQETALNVLSITASQDRVLNWEKFEEAKALLPKTTHYLTIQGGNHSGFGLYGQQKGDGQASLSAEEQQEQVVEAIHAFITKTVSF